ncbi:MAG TPA: 16S rRNA (guanine(527)-N(7))-methyltransferase RsmG [Albitalea sp.]
MTEVTDARAPALEDIALRLGLPLSAPAAGKLLRYLDLLQRWNSTYNLTAVRDPAEMLTQHLADCLAVIGPLRRALAGHAAARILDVGSGGGLPGVVIAAMCPAWQVVCVDAVGKKAAFIRQAGLELQLPNLRAEHGRVEQLSAGQFDLIISRAFASLSDFTRLTRRLLAPDGIWVAMKGRRPEDELRELREVGVFHVEHIDVPGLNAERCLVWMRPQAALNDTRS